MEILLPQFDIEKAISSQWDAVNAKSTIVENDRITAQETSVKALTSQFKKEVDAYLDSNIQSALKLSILEPQTLDIFAVKGEMLYGNIKIILRRDKQNWTIDSAVFNVTTTGELLQKTLLLELGRFKHESNSK